MSDQSGGHTMTKEEQKLINNIYLAETPAEMVEAFKAAFDACDPGHIPLMLLLFEQSDSGVDDIIEREYFKAVDTGRIS